MSIETFEDLDNLVSKKLDEISKIVHGCLDEFKTEQGVNHNFIKAFYLTIASSVSQGCIRSVASSFNESKLDLLNDFVAVLQNSLFKEKAPEFTKNMGKPINWN